MNMVTPEEYNSLSPSQRSGYLQNLQNEGADVEGASQMRQGGVTDNSGLFGYVSRQATGFAMAKSGLSSIPGVGAALPAGLDAALRGGTAEDVGFNATRAGAASLAGYGVNALTGFAPAAAVGGSLAAEAFSDDPNYGAAATRSGITSGLGYAAMAALGPIAGLVGGGLAGYFVKKSMEDGYLGDWTDARKDEMQKDAVERQGFSVGDTADMAAVDDSGWFDDSPFGLEAQFGATTLGNISQATNKDDVFGSIDLPSFTQYGLNRDDGIDNNQQATQTITTGMTDLPQTIEEYNAFGKPGSGGYGSNDHDTSGHASQGGDESGGGDDSESSGGYSEDNDGHGE